MQLPCMMLLLFTKKKTHWCSVSIYKNNVIKCDVKVRNTGGSGSWVKNDAALFISGQSLILFEACNVKFTLPRSNDVAKSKMNCQLHYLHSFISKINYEQNIIKSEHSNKDLVFRISGDLQ